VKRKERAPRKKKRISCELFVNGARYSGIVLDVSASGLFVQTTGKPNPGDAVTVGLSLPGSKEPIVMETRVARKKLVPPELLTVAQGGIGLAITQPAEAYLDFIAEMSTEHAEYAEQARAKAAAPAGTGSRKAGAGSSGSGGGSGAAAQKRFRIHAVETASGRKSTFLASCESEQEANDQVNEQFGEAWHVLFIERA
jgi:Tfp pilus assembly protein PilZ